MKKFMYIGADGGGTKTTIAAAQANSKEILAVSQGEGINYNFIDVKKAAANFADGVKKLPVYGEYSIGGIAIGDPSIDDTVGAGPLTATFVSLVREYLDLPPECPVLIKSDVFMTLYGATGGKPGILMISGTGSMGIAMDKEGTLYAAGGWGRLTEDEGSGYYIAVNGIKAACRYFDNAGPKTALLEECCRYFGTKNLRDFFANYYADPESFPPVAGFAKYVGEAAVYDAEAAKILNNCADTLIDETLALFQKAGLTDCPVGIYGSVLLRNPIVRERFEKAVLSAYPNAQISCPTVTPEEAALQYLFSQMTNS